VAPQIASGDHQIDGEQYDRDGHGCDDARVMRVPRPAEDDRGRGNRDRPGAQTDLCEQRTPVKLAAVLADELRDAEHEQEVGDDRARERSEHDAVQAAGNGDERDDQLGCVPEARIQVPADPRPRVLGRVLGRLADQPRERDERDCGENEERCLARMGERVDEDRRGREGKRRPEDPAGQGR
jgi:hypothetical protein